MKRLWMFVLILATLAAMAIPTNAAELQKGDVNGDGAINSLDAAWVLKKEVGQISFNLEESFRAEVNDDGWIDSLDATWILKYDAGLLSPEEIAPEQPEDEGVSIGVEGAALAYADCLDLDDDDIRTESLDGRGLYRFDSVDEIRAFRAKYNYYYNNLESGYDEVPSFDSVTEAYDEEFFEDNCVLLRYISSAGSERYTVYDLRVVESLNKLVFYYGHVDYNEMTTDDMNGFFVIVPVLKSDIAGCTVYDSRYVRPAYVYTPDETWNGFVVKETLYDGTEKGLVAALAKEGGIPEGSVLKSFEYCWSERSPALTKPTVMTLVADELCMRAVTPVPARIAKKRLRVIYLSAALSLSPAISLSPSLISPMP